MKRNSMSEEVALWGNLYAPVTFAMGFLQAPLDVVADGLTAWRREIYGSVKSKRLNGGLRANLLKLEPLTVGVRPRELLVSTANPEWTAVFDCGHRGGDPIMTVSYLAQTLKIHGVVVVSVPGARTTVGPRTYGARQLEMYGPVATDFLNYVRTLSVIQDGSRWRFDANGTVQDFEDVEAYKRKKVTERFTASMLVDYAAALGLRPFDGDFFPGPCVLVRSPIVPRSAVMSISDAQRRDGIVPTQHE